MKHWKRWSQMECKKRTLVMQWHRFCVLRPFWVHAVHYRWWSEATGCCGGTQAHQKLSCNFEITAINLFKRGKLNCYETVGVFVVVVLPILRPARCMFQAKDNDPKNEEEKYSICAASFNIKVTIASSSHDCTRDEFIQFCIECVSNISTYIWC